MKITVVSVGLCIGPRLVRHLKRDGEELTVEEDTRVLVSVWKGLM